MFTKNVTLHFHGVPPMPLHFAVAKVDYGLSVKELVLKSIGNSPGNSMRTKHQKEKELQKNQYTWLLIVSLFLVGLIRHSCQETIDMLIIICI